MTIAAKLHEELATKYKMSPNDFRREMQDIHSTLEPLEWNVQIFEQGKKYDFHVVRQGLGPLNTEFGRIYVMAYAVNDAWGEYQVVLPPQNLDERSFHPVWNTEKGIIIRLDSACITGQLWGDLTCDCRSQTIMTLKDIIRSQGVIVHIRNHEGRGKQLAFHLATLMAQERLGLDTVEAATALAEHGDIDTRTFGGAIAVLATLGIPAGATIHLAANNPQKKQIFLENGYVLGALHPVSVPATAWTERHFRAKAIHLGHTGLIVGSSTRG